MTAGWIVRFADDGALNIEHRSETRRVLIAIEADGRESGWHCVSTREDGGVLAHGPLNTARADQIKRFIEDGTAPESLPSEPLARVEGTLRTFEGKVYRSPSHGLYVGPAAGIDKVPMRADWPGAHVGQRVELTIRVLP